MGTRRGGLAVAFATALVAVAGSVYADVTTERPASILVFPKIISNQNRDTLVSISNTSNSVVHAHCFYVNAALQNPNEEQSPLNPPLWQEIDFTIALTRQQPTYWSVATGRRVNPVDRLCGAPVALQNGHEICGYEGFDPGFIPPVVPDFQGELKCIEVDESGAPVAGNHLKGEARLTDNLLARLLENGDIVIAGPSTYNALGVLGSENNGDGTLVLGGGQCADSGAVCISDENCEGQGACVFEYNACPQTWILNHQPDGAPNPALEDDEMLAPSIVLTEVTVVPCTQNFETQIPTSVTIQFQIYDEFESVFSVSTTVVCWANLRLSALGLTTLVFGFLDPPDPQGTMYMQTRMRNAMGTPFGFFAVAEETHIAQQSVIDAGAEDIVVRFGSRAAFNLHVEGDKTTPDVITVPDDQLVP